MRPVTVVTGAAGFIGTHLARGLVRGGASVRALDVRELGARLDLPGITRHRVDIRDGRRLSETLRGADTVHHLASAHLEVRLGEERFHEVNVRAAQDLVAICAAAGVRRLVHASTVGIYGHVAHPPAREDSPTAPGNAYERTKLEGEIAVREAADRAGLDLVVLRPAWVYGPGCPRLAKLLRTIGRGRFVYVGEGRNLRHPVYVSDVVDAFRLAASAAPELAGRVYLIAGPRAVPLRELVESCARALGVPAPRRRLPRGLALALGRTAELAWSLAGREPPFSRRSIVFFENDNAFDTTAARRDLGFEPGVDLDEGIRRTVEDREWALTA
jgi:dihydroflavonol-4-reductase